MYLREIFGTRTGAWPSRAAPLCLLLLTGCLALPLPFPDPPTGSGTGATRSTRTPPAAELEMEVHERINRHRASRGLPPLTFDDRLAELAREHSRTMARRRTIGHEGFQERSAEIQRLLPITSTAENVAYNTVTGPDLPGTVVRQWITSSGHRKNIEGSFDLTGVGMASTRDGLHYFTQIFVARRK